MSARGRLGSSSVGLLVAALVVHLALTALHGVAHATIPVPTAGWTAAYAAVVLFGLPVVGAALAFRGRVGTGSLLALAGGVGATGFELLAHFVVADPDHVASVEAGAALFAGTAGLSLAGDVLLALAAAWALRGQAQGSSTSSSSRSTT